MEDPIYTDTKPAAVEPEETSRPTMGPGIETSTELERAQEKAAVRPGEGNTESDPKQHVLAEVLTLALTLTPSSIPQIGHLKFS